MKKYVVYYRISTKKQGESGLGLAAQERDVNLFLEQYSETPFEVVGTFTDIESGMKDNRTEYMKAVLLTKKTKAILLVAKLDRISRKVSTIAKLMEDVDFKVATMPNADKFQLHIYAALAEQERDFISKRTIAALREAKARGVVLGGNRGNIDKANEAASAKAKNDAEQYRVQIQLIVDSGVCTMKGIAEKLNGLGLVTVRGGKFQATQVKRLIDKLEIGKK
ncbi:recombinase family protein [Shewanella polaris]|uniref:Recombinase family protein n=1 Tax=Shewanella polaris TaxID=2588449 RepID=A0A4Y5YFX7_9GAMM|nr:recombinase family protein [Shewanella polaris]QDE31691.1 recombinase family protein [Shewanella polaris]